MKHWLLIDRNQDPSERYQLFNRMPPLLRAAKRLGWKFWLEPDPANWRPKMIAFCAYQGVNLQIVCVKLKNDGTKKDQRGSA